VVQEVSSHLGGAPSSCRERIHPAAPDGNEGELGGDKEAVDQHQQQDRAEPPRNRVSVWIDF
jgi:hypothetical protein